MLRDPESMKLKGRRKMEQKDREKIVCSQFIKLFSINPAKFVGYYD